MVDKIKHKTYAVYIQALQILEKYNPNAEHVLTAAHDIIYLRCPVERVSDEDIAALRESGVFYDEDLDSFYVLT